jgi:hypothetical protein
MQFIKHLLSNDGLVSSKRFAGIAAFINAIVLGYLPNSKQYVFEGFLWYSAAVFGVTAFEKFTKNERSKDNREDSAATS